MKKMRVKANMFLLTKELDRMGGVLPWSETHALFGGKWLKKARQHSLVEMNPDPHTGRERRTVGQRIKIFVAGWRKRGIKHGTVTTVRYGANVVPRTVTLTNEGISFLEKRGYKPTTPRRTEKEIAPQVEKVEKAIALEKEKGIEKKPGLWVRLISWVRSLWTSPTSNET